MCKGYTAPAIDRDGRHAQRVVDELLRVERALDDPESVSAVPNTLTCGRAAAVVREIMKRGLTKPKDPTNG